MHLFNSVCRLEQIPAVLFLFSSWCNVMSEVRSRACGYLGEARAEWALEPCPRAGSLNPSASPPRPEQVASPSSKQRRGARGGPNRGLWPLLLILAFHVGDSASGTLGVATVGAWPNRGGATNGGVTRFPLGHAHR